MLEIGRHGPSAKLVACRRVCAGSASPPFRSDTLRRCRALRSPAVVARGRGRQICGEVELLQLCGHSSGAVLVASRAAPCPVHFKLSDAGKHSGTVSPRSLSSGTPRSHPVSLSAERRVLMLALTPHPVLPTPHQQGWAKPESQTKSNAAGHVVFLEVARRCTPTTSIGVRRCARCSPTL